MWRTLDLAEMVASRRITPGIDYLDSEPDKVSVIAGYNRESMFQSRCRDHAICGIKRSPSELTSTFQLPHRSATE